MMSIRVLAMSGGWKWGCGAAKCLGTSARSKPKLWRYWSPGPGCDESQLLSARCVPSREIVACKRFAGERHCFPKGAVVAHLLIRFFSGA